jgi:type IV pilus assembly protein PilC
MGQLMSGELTTTEKQIWLSLKERATIARQLSALMDAGLPIVKAIRIIEQQVCHPKLKGELQQILFELEEGISLSQAFRRWDGFMVSLLKAGEVGGELPGVLNRLAHFYEERFRLQNKMITTLTYPLVILFVSLLVFVGMITFILPQFGQVYARLGGTLPAYTQFWINVSVLARSPYGLGLAVILSLVCYGLISKQNHYLTVLEKYLVGVPILGEIVVQFSVTRFSRTLGTLLKCGIPLTKSLDITSLTLFPMAAIKVDVSEGIKLHQSMEKYPHLFPDMLKAMVAVGEETGELNKLLLKAADYYDLELDGLLSRLTALIEPAIIIVLGGLIGSVVIGMYLPMFQLFNEIQ